MLLVDDDDSLRRALVRTLRQEGFDVTGYASVEALLAAGVPERDAYLVLDVNMPGIDGIAFKRTLVESGRDLPTVFITALEPRGRERTACGARAGRGALQALQERGPARGARPCRCALRNNPDRRSETMRRKIVLAAVRAPRALFGYETALKQPDQTPMLWNLAPTR